MLAKATAILVSVIVLGSAATSWAGEAKSGHPRPRSLARDGGGPPTIDIQKTCRENVNALSTTLLGGDIDQNIQVCLTDEQSALDQMVKDWATYPAIVKERCVQPKEYLPGYVEWHTCLEMTRDVLKLRKAETSGSNASGTSGSSASRRTSRRHGSAVKGECPIVKYTEQGSIDYVINCPGPGM